MRCSASSLIIFILLVFGICIGIIWVMLFPPSQTEHYLPSSDTYNMEVGMEKYCPSCGSANEASAEFCINCGCQLMNTYNY